MNPGLLAGSGSPIPGRPSQVDQRAQLPAAAADTAWVTLPRQVLPQTTYLVTRRVSQRQFLLKPTAQSRQAALYCFHRAAEVYGVSMHALQVLDNHYHAVLTDPRGELPGFMAWVNRELAKCMNELYDRSEAFWSDDPYSSVTLHDREAVIDKCGYLFVNVVQALLVRDFRDWHGVRSTPADWLAAPATVKRPEFHFGQKDKRWAEVPVRYTLPPALADRDPQHVVADMEALIAERQRAIRVQTARDGKTFWGTKRLEKLNPFDAPKTPRPKGKLNPTFAAGTAEGQRRGRAILNAFRSAYREALHKWRHGLACVFPAGTFWLARFARVACAPLETACPALDSS